MKHFALSALLFAISTVPAWAQSPEMAGGMRQSGKIYVVVAVILLIFAGIIILLLALERRIKKMEDEMNRNR